MTPAPRRMVISGCSGGGKSTLIQALSDQGYAVVHEPGRRIVDAAAGPDDPRLPWNDPEAFAREALAMARADWVAAVAPLTFFDRGIVDAASALNAVANATDALTIAARERYDTIVFLVPPWPEIYRTDPDRRHGFDQALGEYDRLVRDYGALGYETVVLPRMTVAVRLSVLLNTLEITP